MHLNLLCGLLELVEGAADDSRALDLGNSGLVAVKVSRCGLGVALSQLLAPCGCSELVEDISIIDSLLEHGLLGKTRDVDLEVSDAQTLEVNGATDLIGTINQSLQNI